MVAVVTGDLSKAAVCEMHRDTQTHCILTSWHIQHQATPNRGKWTMPEHYTALVEWLYTFHFHILGIYLPYY